MKTGFTMKALSLAVLGMAGLGFGANAFAACPTTITKGETPAGAWDAVSVVGGNAVIGGAAANGLIPAGGATTTSCRLDTKIVANAGSAGAFVRDDTPTNEPHYRARFYMNLDNLAGLNGTQPVRVFSATTNTPANSVPEVVKLTVFGNAAGTSKVLGITAANGTSTTSSTASLGSTTGWRRVEVDFVKGTAGTGHVYIWIDGNVDTANPNTKVEVDNSAWGGVDSATLGLSTASAAYRTAQLNKVVGFDEFDSRRTSFVGN